MPSLNFKKQFAPLVQNGKKRHTIRSKRKRPIKIGDKLYLYTGLRTKHTKKLLETTCTVLESIEIGTSQIKINGHLLDKAGENKLATLDGFNNVTEFRNFFQKTYSLPFKGIFIGWWK